MPFEFVCQATFVERLDGTRVRVRRAGEHIRDAAEIAAIKQSHPSFVVRVWGDEPYPEAAPAIEPADAPAQP